MNEELKKFYRSVIERVATEIWKLSALPTTGTTHIVNLPCDRVYMSLAGGPIFSLKKSSRPYIL